MYIWNGAGLDAKVDDAGFDLPDKDEGAEMAVARDKQSTGGYRCLEYRLIGGTSEAGFRSRDDVVPKYPARTAR